MEKLILFGILSVPVIWISRKTLFNFKSHGFSHDGHFAEASYNRVADLIGLFDAGIVYKVLTG